MENERTDRVKLESVPSQETEGSVGSAPETQEKRTRFSLSHDEGSIGNYLSVANYMG